MWPTDMLSELHDRTSLLFYWLWPRVEGEITAVRILGGRGQLLVEYRFSLGDGYYTGETGFPSWFDGVNISEVLRIG
jgi:hypothetical protein